MKKLQLLFLSLFIGFSVQQSTAQVHDSAYVDGALYFKMKDNFVGPFGLTHPAMLPLVNLYHMDTCYQPFTNLGADTLERTYLLRFSDTAKMELCRDTLRSLSVIDYVEKVPLRRTSLVPNDLNGNQYSLTKISAQLAWNISQGSSSVVVAVVDNGVRISHEDLAANIWVNTGEIAGNGLDDDFNGYTDDRNGFDVADKDGNPSPPTGISQGDAWNHGSHCAGIVSAATNNGKGIASIGFNTRVMPVKCASNSSSSGNELTNTLDGITYAIRNHAKVISMSFGSAESSVTEQVLLNTAHNNGIVLVAAAGNDNVSTPFFPASYANVISVGATDQADLKASFSNFGATVDLMAPGVSILSTLGSGDSDYGNFSGTSMATPLVAGLAGLVLALNPSFTPAQVESRLKSSADNITLLNPTFTGQLGAGRINAFKALGGVPSGIDDVITESVQVYPNPVGDRLVIKLNAGAQSAEVDWIDMQGRNCGHESVLAGVELTELATGNLPTGVYILKIICGNNVTCRRMVKL